MYYFDKNNKGVPISSPSDNINNNNNNNNNNSNINDSSIRRQSFHPSSSHQQSCSLDDSFSFLNFDNNTAHASFLQDGAMDALGQDSLLAQDWNNMYDSTLLDNHQQQNQLFTPFQQQHDAHRSQSALGENSNPFLPQTEQEQRAILMTEPNFLRQQHLLHDSKMKMMEEHNMHDTNDLVSASPIRSNLSAMFGHPVTATNNHSMASSPLSSSVPSSHNEMPATSNDILPSSYQPSAMSHSLGFENSQHHQHQPYSTSASSIFTTNVKRASSSNTKPRKEINRRSQQGIGSRGHNRANPIPINAGSSSTSGAITKHSSSVPTEIDHQRRFNELQARFRVNYARKSSTSSQQREHSVSSSSFSGGSSCFGNRTSRDYMTGNGGASVFGSSMPTSMEKRRSESIYGDDNDTENDASRSSRAMEPSPNQTVTAGVGIPKKNSNRGNSFSSNSMKQASSFPSRTMPIQIQRIQRANMNQPIDADQRQKLLDDQLVKANFDDITVSELKEMLRQRGKPATGKKAILLQRLVNERDNISAARGGKAVHRHSQPPLSSSLENRNSMEAAYSSPLLESPSSMPSSSMLLASSPGSMTHSLNRSIANMHIGSGPSSRLDTSPKLQFQEQAYSSSVPNSYLSPSTKYNELMIPSLSFNDGFSPISPSLNSTTTTTQNKQPQQDWNEHQNAYAPVTSSTLATPDRDNDKDPFDVTTKGAMMLNTGRQIPLYDDFYRTHQDHHETKDETMEWINQPLAGYASLNGILQDLPEGVSIDQFMVWLNENDQFNMNMEPMKADTAGMTPMDINQPNYSDEPLYDDLAPGGHGYST